MKNNLSIHEKQTPCVLKALASYMEDGKREKKK